MLYLLDLNDFNRGNSPGLKATENDSILSRNYPSLKLTRLSFGFSRTNEIFLQTAHGLPHSQKKIDEFESPVHSLLLIKFY